MGATASPSHSAIASTSSGSREKSSETASTAPGHIKGHHRRTSSLWIPPSRPAFYNPGNVLRHKAESSGRALRGLMPPFAKRFFQARNEIRPQRVVVPNNEEDPPPRYMHPNRMYLNNRISTTKYNIFTFLPKNLFEQFHRSANLYFIFIVVLNMIIEAFGRYISMIPIAFVLCVTAVKDAFEDYRRYKSDSKINHQKCRVWDASEKRYRKMEWKNILVGDFVHLSHDEIIPADLLLLKSSDPSGICYVETSNLDGESNLKQRQVARAMGKYHSLTVQQEFHLSKFKYRVVVEPPCTDVYKFEGRLEATEESAPLAREHTLLAKENVLLRGCVVRNTDYVEGIVLYAGHDTKAMLNNSGSRYKRSKLEKLTNLDIIWCVIILLLLCVTAAVLSGAWIASFDTRAEVPFLPLKANETKIEPTHEAFYNFWSYIIVLQVMIPISLYVSIEIIKLGQIWLLSQDVNMYYEPLDKRIQCRALNIPEELGQVQYVMSDKTGTLTENDMVFRRCSLIGRDFGGGSPLTGTVGAALAGPSSTVANGKARSRHSKDPTLEVMLATTVKAADTHSPLFTFFVGLAICNSVVVNAKPHEDMMDDFGDIITERVEKESSEAETETKCSREGLCVQFIEEEDEKEEDLKVAKKVEEAVVGENGIELIELSLEEKVEEKEKSAPKPPLQSIIAAHARSSLISLAKWKGGLKDLTTFRRTEKRASVATLPEIPPPVSFYDSESPDELALVEAAKEYGIRLMRRHFDEVTIHARATGQYIKYKVLHTLPFDADRKRMSVVVRENSGKGRIMLLTKGADSAILDEERVSRSFTESPEGEVAITNARQHLSEYARAGLRTLCVARRWLDEEEYAEWRVAHEEAELDPHHRENLLRESYDAIERHFELLGVTAIEDRLQDGVAECIESLRAAGISVWVLTGDKVETAVNIAYSSKLFSDSMDLLSMNSSGVGVVSDLLDLHLSRVENVDKMTHEAMFGVVLSANCLEYCLEKQNVARFCRLLQRCDALLCCRATPLQKASLVRLAKSALKAKVLAIGDGANDVSMIQGADVGVGLSGQEGMQAVMASDFALARFRFLSRLLLVHGHWCYHRLAIVILYFFYKNAMFVLCIFWYQIFNGFSSQVPIDPIYLMVYNFLFTSLPSLIYGCMEQDASADILLANPIFYEHGRLGKKYRWFSFWLNMLDAVWQSAAVYFVAHFSFISTDVDMWTFGVLLCAQLLFVNSLHLIFIVQLWTFALFFSIVLSIAAFFSFALIYNLMVTPSWGVKDTPAMIAELAVIQPRFWLVLALSAVVALLPRLLWVTIRNSLFPSRLLLARIEENKRASVQSKPVASSIITTTTLNCLWVQDKKKRRLAEKNTCVAVASSSVGSTNFSTIPSA